MAKRILFVTVRYPAPIMIADGPMTKLLPETPYPTRQQSAAWVKPGRMLLAGTLAVFLGACSQRGAIIIYPEAETVGTVVEIMSATSRGASDTALIAPRERAETLRWADFRVSVPPERRQGTVTFTRSNVPNAKTDFLTVSAEQIPDERSFLAALNTRLASRPPAAREVMVFVHGFNTNFAEGLYRHAQMAHDFRSPGVSLSYSWPSAGSLAAYAFDRESALFARDGLEQTLEIASRSIANDIVLVGHSMGAFLVMEAVRQMAIRGADRELDRLQAVVLIAPDLDVDVFRMQMAQLAPRELPIYIAISGRDRALRASGLLRGQSDRVGSVREIERLSDLPGVVVVDLTEMQGENDPSNHFVVATSPAMISLISGLDRFGQTVLRDETRQGNVFQATVGAVAGATGVVLQPLLP